MYSIILPLQEYLYVHLILCLQLVRYATLRCLFWMQKDVYYAGFFVLKWRCSCLAYGDEFYCTYPISADCGRSGPLVSLHRNKEQVKCVIFIIPALHNSTCKEQNANHLYSICLRGRCYRGTRCVCTKDQSYGTLQCARY